MTPLQGLKALRKLLADPKHWMRGRYARDIKGNTVPPLDPTAACWCIMGGIIKVTSGNEVDARDVRNKMLRALSSGGAAPYLIEFNDKRGRKHAEVLELIDAGIAYLKG
jgi:hypothetical protein